MEIFCFSDAEAKTEDRDGIKIHHIAKPRGLRIRGGAELLKEIKKLNKKPDIIHGISTIPFGWLFPYGKRGLDSKFVLSVHGTINPTKKVEFKSSASRRDSMEYEKLMRYLGKRVDLVLPVAEFIKQEFIEAGIDPDKVKVVGTGLDYELFRDYPRPQKKDDKFIVLNVGRFTQQKGLKYLIDAIDILKEHDIELNLIGGGESDDYYSDMEQQIADLGLEEKVKILEKVPYSELPGIYKSANVFVLSSLLEPRAKVIQEAQASGVPVIATDQGGVPETVTDGVDGMLVPPADAGAIAEKILSLKNDPGLREILIKNGEENAKQFDWKIIAEEYTKKFNSIL
ncbi:glycosyltransferase family 4 protein [Patescibacteria group bacterium]|nr:glycosyltransferase family 4 protein [Patescibacteria group bacterium]